MKDGYIALKLSFFLHIKFTTGYQYYYWLLLQISVLQRYRNLLKY